jgi:hypothetical protein
MLGLILGAGILGLIIAVMEQGEFPGWINMIICRPADHRAEGPCRQANREELVAVEVAADLDQAQREAGEADRQGQDELGAAGHGRRPAAAVRGRYPSLGRLRRVSNRRIGADRSRAGLTIQGGKFPGYSAHCMQSHGPGAH